MKWTLVVFNGLDNVLTSLAEGRDVYALERLESGNYKLKQSSAWLPENPSKRCSSPPVNLSAHGRNWPLGSRCASASFSALKIATSRRSPYTTMCFCKESVRIRTMQKRVKKPSWFPPIVPASSMCASARPWANSRMRKKALTSMSQRRPPDT